MFSPEFMKYLINYQKSEFTPDSTKKEIKFNTPSKGRKILAAVALMIYAK